MGGSRCRNFWVARSVSPSSNSKLHTSGVRGEMPRAHAWWNGNRRDGARFASVEAVRCWLQAVRGRGRRFVFRSSKRPTGESSVTLAVNFWKRWESWQGTGCAAACAHTPHATQPCADGASQPGRCKGGQVTRGRHLPATNDRDRGLGLEAVGTGWLHANTHRRPTRRPSCLPPCSSSPPPSPIDVSAAFKNGTPYRWGCFVVQAVQHLKKEARRPCL